MRDNKGYFICEILVGIATLIFTIKLNSYNEILKSIQCKYDNEIEQALGIASHPDYFNYFLWGIIFIALLIGYTIFIFKSRIGSEALIIFIINFVLLIVLLIIFWNPILTTFAILLLGGGIFTIANN